MKKQYDLEERTFKFAKSVIKLINKVPKTLANVEIARQLIKSSGSAGANYIEANEALSRKDYIYRIKVCRKEAKESTYWIRLLDYPDDCNKEVEYLKQKSIELTKIFGAIYRKSSAD